LTPADRAFAGYACDVFVISFGFEADAFSFLTLARRALIAALFFSLHAAESPCLFCGVAAFIEWTSDCPPIVCWQWLRAPLRQRMAIDGSVVGESMMKSKA
jgi:hypothetical protein